MVYNNVERQAPLLICYGVSHSSKRVCHVPEREAREKGKEGGGLQQSL